VNLYHTLLVGRLEGSERRPGAVTGAFAKGEAGVAAICLPAFGES
jgi:hypothetical protein